MRAYIDDAASAMPGVPDYGTDDLAKMRCAEPSVRGGKLAARLRPNMMPYFVHGREADLPGDSRRLLQRRPSNGQAQTEQNGT